jgi:PII-like signaling protein
MKVWKQLSIYTSEGSRLGTRALHTAMIATALEQGLYSAIAVKSMEGFGPQMAIPTANHMALDSDLPIEVRIIDEPERINEFLASQRDTLSTCVVVLRDVEIFWAPQS